jgi:CO/xanthine dehydrogenase Mo-binding subunit
MTAPDGYLDVLDPRFPIRLSMPETLFWEMVTLRPDRACADGQAARARQQAARQQERYVTPQPRFVPERAHEETAEDMGLPPEWWRDDSFPREGMPQPASTDVFIAVSDQALAHERKAAERRAVRRARRFVVRLVRGT